MIHLPFMEIQYGWKTFSYTHWITMYIDIEVISLILSFLCGCAAIHISFLDGEQMNGRVHATMTRSKYSMNPTRTQSKTLIFWPAIKLDRNEPNNNNNNKKIESFSLSFQTERLYAMKRN